MTGRVLSIEVGTRMLRGPAAETARKARIRARFWEAKGRARRSEYSKADFALFGDPQQLLDMPRFEFDDVG